MADHTGIEWAEATWNPTVGCTHVSPGCDNCYAARLASTRLAHLDRYTGLASGGQFTGEVRLVPQVLDKPLRWRRPRRIFVNSMSDLFHYQVPDEFIARVFAVMAIASRHTFQVLTKRHRRMRSLLSSPSFGHLVAEQGRAHHVGCQQDWLAVGAMLGGRPLPNVHLGVSVEDQQWADIRIPALLDTPAAVRWISAEPLLGPLQLRDHWVQPTSPGAPRLDWIVVGGETGPLPDVRWMHLGWVRSLITQARGAGTPMFIKQLGTIWAQQLGIAGPDPGASSPGGWPADLRIRDYPTHAPASPGLVRGAA